jgi:hypothetical protein
MRVDISIDAGQGGAMSATTPAIRTTGDVATSDAGPSAVAGAGAIDAGPPDPALLAELAAAGGRGALLTSGWPVTQNGQGTEAVNAGSAPG